MMKEKAVLQQVPWGRGLRSLSAFLRNYGASWAASFAFRREGGRLCSCSRWKFSSSEAGLTYPQPSHFSDESLFSLAPLFRTAG